MEDASLFEFAKPGKAFMDETFDNASVHKGSASLAESILAEELERILAIGLSVHDIGWEVVNDLATHAADCIGAKAYRWYDYVVPEELQDATAPRLRKAYKATLAYTDTAPKAGRDRAIVCLGGIVNSARRFDFLAADLADTHRIIAVDWPGRGHSGWLAQQSHYTHAVLAHAIESLIDGLGLRRVILIGSSLGGTIGMDIASRRPALVERLILNDIGPEMPAERRTRRAESVSRHYIFPQPVDLFRRAGAAQKHDGPIGDAVRLHNLMGQTKRCQAGGGREYRHDPRTTQAYAETASSDINQWDTFHALQSPLLVLHGEDSDALLPATVRRMQDAKGRQMTVAHVPATGHTPALADSDSVSLIAAWVAGHPLPEELTLPRRQAPRRLLFTGGAPERLPVEAKTAMPVYQIWGQAFPLQQF